MKLDVLVKKPIFSKTLWGILTGVFGVIFAAFVILSCIAINVASAAINMMFGTSNFETVNDPDAVVTDFYKTSYSFERNGENLYKEDTAMIEEAEAAGAVLLWNKNNALPLAGNEKVSLLGHASADIVECGTGSGYVRTYDYKAGKMATVTMRESFESRGFEVNPTLWSFYVSGAGSSYKMINWDKTICKEWREWYVNEVPWRVYNDSVKSSFQKYGDVAVVTLARSGGEYSDLHYNYTSATDYIGANDKGGKENSSANGGYLGLSPEEKELLDNVTKSGFGKVIVLLNTGNPLQMQDFEPYMDKIDACMWIGQPGSTGMNGVVDLLKGKDMKGNPLVPSGRLTDTWAYDNNSAPASVNDGNHVYDNVNLLNNSHGTTSFASKYMVYQEGIYIGYRYYETRYYDSIVGSGNATSAAGAKHSASGWNYGEEVAFPFGYGISYSEFDYSGFGATEHGDNYEVTVTVTNKGPHSGKEVVQVYLSKPYTDYDIENNIEKSAVELAGYAKTGVLAPGASETVTVTVPKEYFKTYDADGEQTYIIERGDYWLTVATDSHQAVNNILSAQGHGTDESKVLSGKVASSKVLGASFAKKFELARDYKTYSKSSQTGYDVTNQLSSGDINKYVNRGDNKVTYLSRNDWAATYPAAPAKLSLNADMANDLHFDITPDAAGYEMPEEKQFASGSTDGSPDVKAGDLVAYMFMDAPLYPEKVTDEELLKLVYDDGLPYVKHWEKMWNQLLDQMSYEEQALIVANSYHLINGAVSIALPGSKQENGPVGITKREELYFSVPNDETIKGENGTGWTWVAYPCAGILAASFDVDIARRVGEHKSEDMLYLGYNGIYGPGVNMHRSPFGGRAFEYPSEDPYLAGYTEAHESIGIESKGCLAYAKHYALNDMETNRVNCGIWSNEQASREIYLRAFEIVFTEGKASATMNSFTRIGTKWNGASYAMMTEILRNEWGYDGLVISDWVTGGSAMSGVDGVMAGTDTFDGNWKADKFAPYRDNAAVAQALRLATKRVIYNVVRTNAMNGTSISTRVIRVTPWWETALITLSAVTGVLFVISVAGLVLALTLPARFKRMENIAIVTASDSPSVDSPNANGTNSGAEKSDSEKINE